MPEELRKINTVGARSWSSLTERSVSEDELGHRLPRREDVGAGQPKRAVEILLTYRLQTKRRVNGRCFEYVLSKKHLRFLVRINGRVHELGHHGTNEILAKPKDQN